jgi:prepilin-type N-terminal cleavage/methylation domain-containing protein
MSHRIVRHGQSGFTLVELLIVAIILAILAAIIVPQFASTTTDAQESALRANLSAIRGSIDLYRQQHGEYPAFRAADGGACTGTIGIGAIDTQVGFTEQLTRYTDTDGNACSIGTAAHPFGPYLKDNVIPANPVTGVATIVIVKTGDAGSGDLELLPDAGQNGWKFDNVSGKFFANDAGADSQGINFADY